MPEKSQKNQLFYGDNLDVLRLHVLDESVDLVYLDPPFNSNEGKGGGWAWLLGFGPWTG